MISLNLLPPERKELYRWRKNTKKAILAGIKIVFILVCFTVQFLVLDIYLAGENKALDIQINSIENTTNIKQLNSVEKSFKNLNNILVKINNISNEQVYWSSILEEIIEITPVGVQLFSLEIDSDGKFIVIGKAKAREKVLDFGKKLKNSPDFKDIQTPLDNIIKSSDIDFKFTGIILLDNFKAKEKVRKENIDQI